MFIFSKNQLLVSLIFSIVFFVSISILSVLIFMISFLLLTLGFVYSAFSSCFQCKVRSFIWDFSCFLKQDCVTVNFPLRSAFAASHTFHFGFMFSFSFVSWYFFISSLISSVIHSLFSSILFSFHVFVFFTVFFFLLVVDL